MDQKNKVLAFLLEGPAGGVPGFQRSIVFEASQSDWEAKIRSETHCPGAEVKIVQPSEWDPPYLTEVSQQALSNQFQLILHCMIRYLVNHSIAMDPSELVDGGTVVFSPISGKVFFAYKY